MIKKLTVLFVVFSSIGGCSSESVSEMESQKISSIVANTNPDIDSNSTIPVITDVRLPNYVDATELKIVYITSRSLVKLYTKPSDASKVIDTLDYADWVEVIEDTIGWYGIKYREERTFIEGPNIVSKWETAKYYIKKKLTGEFDDIELIDEDLNIVVYEYYSNVGSQDFSNYWDEGKQLNEILKIELTTAQMYESKKVDAVSFFIDDSDSIKKKKGVITLPCKNKIVKLKDNTDPEFDEDRTHHTLLGQIEAINSYLVRVDLYESSIFKIVNKDNESQFSVFDFPYITPDKSKAIVVSSDYYEGSAEVALYNVSSNKLEPVAQLGYKNWVPCDEPETMFWGNDGYFYFKANHASVAWRDNERNDVYQYLRIKLI